MNTPTEAIRLATIRRLMPQRAKLSYLEALTIAERQANRLVTAWGGGERAIHEADILRIARITVVRGDLGARASGSSRYHQGRWEVVLSNADNETRQRFTLAHELKHILDAGSDLAQLYQRLSDRQIERVCDHFAACLLMSKRSIYSLWGDGLRTPEALAQACRVSVSAMIVRLNVLGLSVNSTSRTVYQCARGLRRVVETVTITSHAPSDHRLEGALA
jgi:Zn-dependent peptidase ImmA (M78 family)